MVKFGGVMISGVTPNRNRFASGAVRLAGPGLAESVTWNAAAAENSEAGAVGSCSHSCTDLVGIVVQAE